MKNDTVSIVLPCYNEAGNIEPLYGELSTVLGGMKRPYEIIFVDDASEDQTLTVAKRLYEGDKHVQVISLLGHQGKAAALLSGFKAAHGNIIIAMDGDGQHDPKYIPEFVAAIDEGCDVASSWKEEESTSALQRTLSKAAHTFIGRLIGVKMKYFGAAMKAYRRDVVENLEFSGELHRFAGALIYRKGITIREIPITIRRRRYGASNYSVWKLFGVLLDIILIKYLVSYSRAPFRFFGVWGFLASSIGGLAVLWVLIQKYVFGEPAFNNTAVLVLAAIFIFVGIQLIFFGLIAELISRLYYTSSGRELAKVRQHLKHGARL